MTRVALRIDLRMIRKPLWVLPLILIALFACRSEPPVVVLHNACPGYTELRGLEFPTSTIAVRFDSLGLVDSTVSWVSPDSFSLRTQVYVHSADKAWLKQLDSIFPAYDVLPGETRGVIQVFAGMNGMVFDSVPFARKLLALNGTSKPGLARDWSYRLSLRLGLAYLEPQNALADTFTVTRLYCSPRDSSLARTIITELRAGQLEVIDNLHEIVIILGSDMLDPNRSVGSAPPGLSVVIKKSLFKLFIYDDGNLVKTYPIALGKNPGDKQKVGDCRTPLGDFTVTAIENSASWEHDFPDDTLGPIPGAYGPWFIRLSTLASETISGMRWGGIGIHGTHDPASIGTLASEGCIRMYNQDVDSLKRLVRIGTPVRIEE